ncbi:hypothetical protein AMATHDRAFT_130946, partial [Amanita thiersii Skay4041]
QTPNQPPSSTQASNTPSPSSSTSRLVIPPSAPAGGLTITQPPQTATSYFKIAPNSPITFGWNMTDVIATPTSLTVSAACNNGNTYAVGPNNGIIPGTATEVVWDLYSYQQNHQATPLAQETYTLMIWDDRGPGAMRLPGFLQANSALKFAIYTPQPYTGLGDGWTCATCNGAWSSYTSHPAFTSIITALLVVFLSGFGLFR